jgi:hypothetical protein
MITTALALACSLSLAPPPPPSVSPPATRGEPKVLWRDESYSASELPDDLPEGTREAIEYWTPFVDEVGYTMQLADGAQFMLVAPKNKLSSKEWDSAIQPTLDLFDELMPVPDRSEDEVTGTTEAGAGDDLSFAWGEVFELEHDLATFFRVKDTDDFELLLNHVAEREEKDDAWASHYLELPGLVLHKPLAGVIVESAPGVEEWDPLNEIVNRIARIMITRRFGKAPHWLSMGIAWHIEMEVRGTIFCFPYRKTFVGVAEHNGWKDSLKKQFKKKSDPPLDVNRLCSWQLGIWDDLQAGRAWGTVKYIAESGPGALSTVLEDMRLLMHEKGRITHDDGTWELIPNYQPDPTDQLAILQRRVEADFREDVTNYFRKGLRGARH